jgi:hypothetical protein
VVAAALRLAAAVPTSCMQVLSTIISVYSMPANVVSNAQQLLKRESVNRRKGNATPSWLL